MISITRLLELKKDLVRIDTLHKSNLANDANYYDLIQQEQRVGIYRDILEDYLRIQRGSA